MLDDLERFEREPVALQRTLLEIEKQIASLTPDIEEKNRAYQEAKAEYEIAALKLKLLKERRSALQSVLKSLSVF
ncbi:MAG TPA: hypothetical protein GXX40_05620 [Firmicutes bacterium]|nr:hypothetical protein [Bacillota bacterium]